MGCPSASPRQLQAFPTRSLSTCQPPLRSTGSTHRSLSGGGSGHESLATHLECDNVLYHTLCQPKMTGSARPPTSSSPRAGSFTPRLCSRQRPRPRSASSSFSPPRSTTNTRVRRTCTPRNNRTSTRRIRFTDPFGLPPVAASADVKHPPATRASEKQSSPSHFSGPYPARFHGSLRILKDG